MDEPSFGPEKWLTDAVMRLCGVLESPQVDRGDMMGDLGLI